MTPVSDERSTEGRTDTHRWPVLASVAAGAAVGVLGRNVPVAIALRSGVGTSETRSCGIEEAARCAFEHLPDALGALLVLGLTVMAITLLFAVAGTALVVMAMTRRRRVAGWGTPAALLAAGTALIMPATWLLVSFLLYSAT